MLFPNNPAGLKTAKIRENPKVSRYKKSQDITALAP
jgi:hypothetical protein